ncbi:MAG: hypothetical protein LBV41_02365 [Cytophagaceae bacterium]|jgi:hypothetical protein|nr:hypothetical protein [Cytophagaceae bacterium]
MANVKKNNDIQQKLFDEIRMNFHSKNSLVYNIADVLNISTDSAYKRMNGTIALNIEETHLLCKYFRVSFDSLIDVGNSGAYEFQAYDISKSVKDYGHAFALLHYLKRIKNSVESNMIISATSIPVYYLMEQKELLFFKLYVWFRGVYEYNGNLNDFINEFDSPEITDCYQQIVDHYKHIPSSEIWKEETVDTFLKVINYHLKVNSFSDMEQPLLLCSQILSVLDKLQIWAKAGKKDESDTTFQFYLCEMDPEQDIHLIIHPDAVSCNIKLFTMNNLKITDRELCDEAERWMSRMMQCSVLLSGSAEGERIKFFDAQKEKVKLLMKQIKVKKKVAQSIVK